MPFTEADQVEEFEIQWKKFEKGGVAHYFAHGKYLLATIFFEIPRWWEPEGSASSLQVRLSLWIGPRGGLTEEWFIVDPDEKIVADRFYCRKYFAPGGEETGWLDLYEIRQAFKDAVKRKDWETLDELCRKTLSELHGTLQKLIRERKDWFRASVRNAHGRETNLITEIDRVTVIGRLPSLGKRK